MNNRFTRLGLFGFFSFCEVLGLLIMYGNGIPYLIYIREHSFVSRWLHISFCLLGINRTRNWQVLMLFLYVAECQLHDAITTLYACV